MPTLFNFKQFHSTFFVSLSQLQKSTQIASKKRKSNFLNTYIVLDMIINKKKKFGLLVPNSQ